MEVKSVCVCRFGAEKPERAPTHCLFCPAAPSGSSGRSGEPSCGFLSSGQVTSELLLRPALRTAPYGRSGRQAATSQAGATPGGGRFKNRQATECNWLEGHSMSRTFALASLVLAMMIPVARAETLADLVSREAGVDFGRCELTPPPSMKGSAIHAVIPARFQVPGIWMTRSLLLVGVDERGTVQDEQELKLVREVPPREVVRVRCSGGRLQVRLSPRASGKTLTHHWTGTQLMPIPASRR